MASFVPLILSLIAAWAIHGVAGQLTSEEEQIFRLRGGTISLDSNDNYQLLCDGIPTHEHSDDTRAIGQAKEYNVTFNRIPVPLTGSGCLMRGPIGFAINCVPFYWPYTTQGTNAVEGNGAINLDSCDGVATRGGHYHYFNGSRCLLDDIFRGNYDEERLYGVALDGYAVYVTKDYTAPPGVALDECNGATVDGRYRYYVTKTFPYLLGCFKGRVHGIIEYEEDVSRDGSTPSGDRDPIPDCVFANKISPTSFDDLTKGVLNHGSDAVTITSSWQTMCMGLLLLLKSI